MSEKRQTGLTLPPVMWGYVEALRQTGLYGDSTSGVLRTLIMAGVQRAIGDGVIKVIKLD